MDRHITGLGEVVARVEEARTEGQAAVVATVVASTWEPIRPSARLLIFEDGQSEGSLEPALDVLVAQAALEALEARASAFATFEQADGDWTRVRPGTGGIDIFLEVLAQAPHLVIVGAGHIAVPLARVASLLDFRVTVLDDRAEYVTRERFPSADELLVGPYAETLSRVPCGRDTFVVLVTRGHVHDLACLQLVLERDGAYIGMIGSRRRVRTVLEGLARHDAPPERLRTVFAPIGLDIGAQTPAEIAVAIMAEIVNVRRGGQGRSLAIGDKLRV